MTTCCLWEPCGPIRALPQKQQKKKSLVVGSGTFAKRSNPSAYGDNDPIRPRTYLGCCLLSISESTGACQVEYSTLFSSFREVRPHFQKQERARSIGFVILHFGRRAHLHPGSSVVQSVVSSFLRDFTLPGGARVSSHIASKRCLSPLSRPSRSAKPPVRRPGGKRSHPSNLKIFIRGGRGGGVGGEKG